MRQDRTTNRIFLTSPIVAGLTKPDANLSACGEVDVNRGEPRMPRAAASVIVHTHRPRVARPTTGSWSARIWAALRAA